MILKKLLPILLTIFTLLPIVSCAKKDNNSITEPKITLADRVGVYKGSGAINEIVNLYAIVKIKDNGEVLAVWSAFESTVVENNLEASTPVLDTKSELTTFDLVRTGNQAYKIVFENKTTIKFTAGDQPNTTITLTKQ